MGFMTISIKIVLFIPPSNLMSGICALFLGLITIMIAVLFMTRKHNWRTGRREKVFFVFRKREGRV